MCGGWGGDHGALLLSIESWILLVTSLYSLVGLAWEVLVVPNI